MKKLHRFGEVPKQKDLHQIRFGKGLANNEIASKAEDILSRNDDFTVKATPLWSVHFYYFHSKAPGIFSQTPAVRLRKSTLWYLKFEWYFHQEIML